MQPSDQDHFDDFDNLTGADDAEMDSPMAPADDGSRQKRQKIFYGTVFAVLCLAAFGGWFIFAGDPAPAVKLPATAPQPVASNNAPPAPPSPLPPEVTAPTPPVETAMLPAPGNPPEMTSGAPASTSGDTSAPPAQLAPVAVSGDPGEMMASALPVPDQQPVGMENPPIDTPMPEAAPVVDQESAGRLSAMESQLQTLAAELTAAKQAAPTPANPDPALSGKLQELTAKLDQMTSQLDALDQRTATLATEVQNVAVSETPKAPEKIEKVIATKEEEEISLSDEMPKPAVPVKKAAAPVKKPAVKKAATPAPVRSWELRSAQPGVAWLGRPGSGEMARYAVGENVPGLGAVRSVSQDANGNWSVNTNGGVIRQ